MSDDSRTIVRYVFAWTVAYAVNLPLAILFGLMVTEKHGRIGMWVAVWLMWTGGALVMSQKWRLREALMTGGILVAAIQLCGVPHIFVGTISIEIWEYVAKWLPESVAEPLSGFCITLMTGQVFILIAIGIGFFWNELSKTPEPKLPDNAPEPETESPNQPAQPPQA